MHILANCKKMFGLQKKYIIESLLDDILLKGEQKYNLSVYFYNPHLLLLVKNARSICNTYMYVYVVPTCKLFTYTTNG